jgi:hypothetical protein
MDMIDLETATRHEFCGCGRGWWKLSDETWALVNRNGSPELPAGVPCVATQIVGNRAEGHRRYYRAERFDDPRPHIAKHGQTPTRILMPVCGPTVEAVVRAAEHEGLHPVIDARGELVIGWSVTGDRVRPADALAVRLVEYADLILAHLSGEPVMCETKGCKDAAARIALPGRPICAKHAVAVLHKEEHPAPDVDYPAVVKMREARPRTAHSIAESLRMSIRPAGEWAAPKQGTRRR